MRKFSTTIFLIISILFVAHIGFTQEKASAILVDSYSWIGADDASARIDGWRNELYKSPNNKGYIIIYGGRISKKGEVEAHIRGMNESFRMKGMDVTNVEIVKGGFREKLVVDFWVVPAGACLPLPTSTVDFEKVRFKGISRKIVPYECC